MHPDSYAFSVAKIRALENKLVNYNQIERLVDAPDASGFFEALTETAYSQHFSDKNNITDFQVILNKELLVSKKTLQRITPDSKQLDWLWLKYDFLNLKLLIKKYLAGYDLNKIELNYLGKYNPQNLLNYITKKELNRLPKKITKLIDSVLETWEESKQPREIDFILDKAYFNFLRNEAETVDSNLVKELIRRKIDLYNLKVFVRIKELEKSQIGRLSNNEKILSRLVIMGGFVKPEIFLKLQKEGIENLLAQPSLRDYRDIISAGLEYYSKEKSFLVFEKLSYEYFINRLRFAKYVAFGIEPLIAYWLAKDNEVNVLRIIMIGKLNNIESKLIHQEIHKLYTEK